MNHLLQLSLSDHSTIFPIEISLGSNLFPTGGKEECSVVKDLLLILMADFRSIKAVLLFKTENLRLGLEMDGPILIYFLDDSLEKGLGIRSFQCVKGLF
jgi:hypothetical protein